MPCSAILKIAQIDRVRLQANVGEKDLASIKVDSRNTERRRARWPARMGAVVAGGLVLTGTGVMAQPVPLPRIDAALTMEQAVELAGEKSLRVKAADAEARTMESMRREALAPFWPQLSADGYLNDQTLAPNVYGSAGPTTARNTQVFNANQAGDANLTAMYSLFTRGRDHYGSSLDGANAPLLGWSAARYNLGTGAETRAGGTGGRGREASAA